MKKINLYFLAFMLFLLLIYHRNIFAVISSPGNIGNTGQILKETFNKSQVIVCGKAGQILEKSNGIITVQNHQVSGIWITANFEVDNLIKGNIESNQIKVQFFITIDPMNVLIDSLPANDRSLLCLILKDENKKIYCLTSVGGSFMLLPENSIKSKEEDDTPEKKIKLILLNAIKSDKNKIVLPALWNLNEWQLIDNNILNVIKDLKNNDDPMIVDLSFALRINHGDPEAMEDLISILNNYQDKDMFPETEMALEDNLENYDIKSIAKLLESKHVILRRAAINILNDIDDKDIIPYLINALDDKDNEVRFGALVGLSYILGPMKVDGKRIEFTLEDQSKCSNLWKSWWEKEGKEKYAKNEKLLTH